MKNTKSLIIAIVAALAIAVGVLGHSANAFALNREIVVYNNTRSTMRELQGSNIGDTIWRWDFLGDSTLPAGYRVTVNIDDRSGYCRYDLKAVFNDGSEVIRRNVNVCTAEAWYIYQFSNFIG
jgi:hypothetical protein